MAQEKPDQGHQRLFRGNHLALAFGSHQKSSNVDKCFVISLREKQLSSYCLERSDMREIIASLLIEIKKRKTW